MVSERGGAWDHYIFGQKHISLVSLQVPRALGLSSSLVIGDGALVLCAECSKIM